MDTVIISTTETTGNGVVLVPREAITPANLGCGRIVIACNINTPTANLPLYIQTNAGNCPLLCPYGNNVLANQLNKRTGYIVRFGNENSSYVDGQFVLANTRCLNGRGTESTEEPATQEEVSETRTKKTTAQ